MEGEPLLFGRLFAGHRVRGRSTPGSKMCGRIMVIKGIGHCLPGRRKACHKNGLLDDRRRTINFQVTTSAAFRKASFSQSESGGLLKVSLNSSDSYSDSVLLRSGVIQSALLYQVNYIQSNRTL